MAKASGVSPEQIAIPPTADGSGNHFGAFCLGRGRSAGLGAINRYEKKSEEARTSG